MLLNENIKPFALVILGNLKFPEFMNNDIDPKSLLTTDSKVTTAKIEEEKVYPVDKMASLEKITGAVPDGGQSPEEISKIVAIYPADALVAYLLRTKLKDIQLPLFRKELKEYPAKAAEFERLWRKAKRKSCNDVWS